MTRSTILHVITPALVAVLLLPVLSPLQASPGLPARPNVIVLLTDDQGYGDLSCLGNPLIRTPNMDKLHAEGVRLTDFHVAPMCTPTRGQIMTGRDCLANGAYLVCSGRSMLRQQIPVPAESLAHVPTMADVFAANGYCTGHFGKWHLGDSCPYRPIDRGFQESVTFPGYGLASCQSYWNNAMLDDWLWHNGRLQQYKGYCTDVWFQEAQQWIKSCAARQQPFFVYLPTNAPHGPVWVPEKYAEPYLGKVSADVAHFYGMIVNIDENMGKLDAMLKTIGLYDNTILIFMTDNGGTLGVKQFNAGMRGMKCDDYEGGHRVPCFIRWPKGRLRPPGDLSELTECQDLLPTLIDLCGLHAPANAHFDGTNLAPLLTGPGQPDLADRMLVVQYGFFDEYEAPIKWRGAVMWNKWRLVHGKELYDIQADPSQKNDVSALNPQVVGRLRTHYEKWWERVEPLAKEFQPLHLGADQENPVTLTSQDWIARNTAGTTAVREGVNRTGPWEVLVERGGDYRITLRRWPAEADLAITAGSPACRKELGSFPAGKALPITRARLTIAAVDLSQPVASGQKAVAFDVRLSAGRTRLQTWFYDGNGAQLCGAYYVEVLRK